MEDRVPLVVEVFIDRVPEERKDKAASIFRPMVPAVGKAEGFKGIKMPLDRRRTNHVLTQQRWSRRKKQTAFLVHFSASSLYWPFAMLRVPLMN